MENNNQNITKGPYGPINARWDGDSIVLSFPDGLSHDQQLEIITLLANSRDIPWTEININHQPDSPNTSNPSSSSLFQTASAPTNQNEQKEQDHPETKNSDMGAS